MTKQMTISKSKSRLITPEGTKDYLYEEVVTRKAVEDNLRVFFENRGFSEVVTPSIEFLDVFSVEGHSIPIEYMYKLTDSKGRLMVMRPDSTMAIARMAATRLKGISYPIRLYYNQAVFSSTRSMSGRSDEIMQAGVELIGESSMIADLEVITTAIQSLLNCKQKSFRIEIGHIGIFNTLIDTLKLDADAKEEIRILIESKNYPALNDMLDSFGNNEAVCVIKQLPRMFGDRTVLKKAANLIADKQTNDILIYLDRLIEKLEQLGFSDRVRVDLGIVNRTDYYTGVVFKGYIEGCGEEVLSGGRYDSLLSKFGESAGAIGFAINVDAVTKAYIKEYKPLYESASVLIFSEKGYELEGIRYMQELSKTTKCELCLFDTLEEARIYAQNKGITAIEVVGNKKETHAVPPKEG